MGKKSKTPKNPNNQADLNLLLTQIQIEAKRKEKSTTMSILMDTLRATLSAMTTKRINDDCLKSSRLCCQLMFQENSLTAEEIKTVERVWIKINKLDMNKFPQDKFLQHVQINLAEMMTSLLEGKLRLGFPLDNWVTQTRTNLKLLREPGNKLIIQSLLPFCMKVIAHQENVLISTAKDEDRNKIIDELWVLVDKLRVFEGNRDNSRKMELCDEEKNTISTLCSEWDDSSEIRKSHVAILCEILTSLEPEELNTCPTFTEKLLVAARFRDIIFIDYVMEIGRNIENKDYVMAGDNIQSLESAFTLTKSEKIEIIAQRVYVNMGTAAAKCEAEEKAKCEAEEKAKCEAEEKAKREAEEKVKREAEEKAIAPTPGGGPGVFAAREAAGQGSETSEAAKREAEERAAQERAVRRAKKQRRKELAEAEKRQAVEKARQDAEKKVKREAEEKAKREAEEQAKREAKEKVKREAEEKAKREKAEKRAEREEKAKQQAEEREKSRADKAKARARKKSEQEDTRRRLEATNVIDLAISLAIKKTITGAIQGELNTFFPFPQEYWAILFKDTEQSGLELYGTQRVLSIFMIPQLHNIIAQASNLKPEAIKIITENCQKISKASDLDFYRCCTSEEYQSFLERAKAGSYEKEIKVKYDEEREYIQFSFTSEGRQYDLTLRGPGYPTIPDLDIFTDLTSSPEEILEKIFNGDFCNISDLPFSEDPQKQLTATLKLFSHFVTYSRMGVVTKEKLNEIFIEIKDKLYKAFEQISIPWDTVNHVSMLLGIIIEKKAIDSLPPDQMAQILDRMMCKLSEISHARVPQLTLLIKLLNKAIEVGGDLGKWTQSEGTKGTEYMSIISRILPRLFSSPEVTISDKLNYLIEHCQLVLSGDTSSLNITEKIKVFLSFIHSIDADDGKAIADLVTQVKDSTVRPKITDITNTCPQECRQLRVAQEFFQQAQITKMAACKALNGKSIFSRDKSEPDCFVKYRQNRYHQANESFCRAKDELTDLLLKIMPKQRLQECFSLLVDFAFGDNTCNDQTQKRFEVFRRDLERLLDETPGSATTMYDATSYRSTLYSSTSSVPCAVESILY